MNLSSVRVEIEHKGSRKAIVLPTNTSEKQILLMCLNLFDIPSDKHVNYELIIEAIECRVETAQALLNNEILMLRDLLESNQNKTEESTILYKGLPKVENENIDRQENSHISEIRAKTEKDGDIYEIFLREIEIDDLNLESNDGKSDMSIETNIQDLLCVSCETRTRLKEHLNLWASKKQNEA